MAIRIMHVVDTLETGGLENGVVNLIQRMDPERFDHVVCAIRNLGPLAERLPPGRVQIMCLNKNHSGFSFLASPLARRIREARAHIVHSRNWGAMEAILAGWCLRSCALVHSEHGIESVQSHAEPRRRRWFRRFAFELADRVFSVSYQLRDFHAQQTGFPLRKIGVIHNGVDMQRFCPQAADRLRARTRLGIPQEDFCIGAVGRLEPVKDILTLLRAAAGFPDSFTSWRLLIAGEGREISALRQFASSHQQLQDRVHFLGEIQNIPELLNAFDVYVLPSRSEGISNSLLEAMATGLPVIASDTGGNPEVVLDGESGLLFPVGGFSMLAARIVSLHQQNEERTRLGQNALRRVKEHFSLDYMVKEYERLYSSLVPRRAAAGLIATRIGA